MEAAVEAARLRLRPIIMTSLAFVLGVAPLVWATGAEAELRQTLRHGRFRRLIGVTQFWLIFTPAFYVLSQWIAGLCRRAGPRRRSRGVARASRQCPVTESGTVMLSIPMSPSARFSISNSCSHSSCVLTGIFPHMKV